MIDSSQGRKSGKKTIYSSRANVKTSQGVYMDKGKRKRRNKRNQKRKHEMLKFGVVIALLVLIVGSIMFVTRKNAINVYAGQHYIGMLKGAKVTEEEITTSITAQLAAKAGANVLINEEIKFEKVRAKKKDLVTLEYVLSEIKNLVTYKVEAAVITVDGGEILAMSTQGEADALLKAIIAEYVPEGVTMSETGFVENVTTKVKFVDSASIVSTEEANKKLTAGTAATRTYTVVAGDNLYKMASKNGTTVEKILEANPGMSINTVQRVGNTVNMQVMVPFISVKTVENLVFTEKQEKQSEYRKDDTKPTTYKKVIQQGKDGQKEVTTQIVRVNGFETEQRAVEEKITVEPVTEIIVVGTK